MRYLLLVLIALLLASCSVKQMNDYHCKRCDIKDSVSHEVTIHDSIIEKIVNVITPADTIKVIEKVPCADLEITKETKRQKIYIRVKDGNLEAEAICKEYEQQIKVNEYHRTLTEKTFVQKVKTITEKPEKTLWYWLSFWQSWACIVLILGYIALKVLAFYKKFSLPF